MNGAKTVFLAKVHYECDGGTFRGTYERVDHEVFSTCSLANDWVEKRREELGKLYYGSDIFEKIVDEFKKEEE